MCDARLNQAEELSLQRNKRPVGGMRGTTQRVYRVTQDPTWIAKASADSVHLFVKSSDGSMFCLTCYLQRSRCAFPVPG
jgi:hypothetical protein